MLNLNKEKLNALMRKPSTWSTIGAALVIIVGLFGITFSDSVVAAWNALVQIMTGG